MITAIIILAILDTLIGNWFFPGKEGIVKRGDVTYSVYKYNRIMFIPIKMWEECVISNSMAVILFDYSLSFSSSETYRDLDWAMKMLTSSRKGERSRSEIIEEVYTTSSFTKKVKHSNIDWLELIDLTEDKNEKEVLISIQKRLER